MKTTNLLLLAIVAIMFLGCQTDPSDENIKETVTALINEDTQYTCPAKNFNKAFKRNVSLATWQGVFKKSDNEYEAKVIIEFDNCWKKKKQETMSFFFTKDTRNKWMMSNVTFDSATQFQAAPTAIYAWYDKIKKRKIMVK